MNKLFYTIFILLGLSLYLPFLMTFNQRHINSQLPLEHVKEVPNIAKFEVIEVNLIARITCYNDSGIMANGKYTYSGAVAVSDRTISLNSKVYVEGYGIMDITDRTAKWVHEKHGLTIDIYSPDCDKTFGVKRLTYKLLK
jgi:3D (Asp-Asp-Asp) domain-containing protein